MVYLSPPALRRLCAAYGLRPQKAYGQHYLITDAPVRRMIEAAKLQATDTVLEIGPGFGILTLAVAPLVQRITAFEIEQRLRPYWEEKQKEYANIEIIWGNALTTLGTSDFPPGTPYKILANLPYQITGEALRMMTELDPPPESIVIMVQKEVAERICALPGYMSLLSVAVQYYGTPSIVAQVPRGSFWPVPKVDSAIVRILMNRESRFTHAASHTPGVFFRVVRAGFSHPRKQLLNNLVNGLQLDPTVVRQVLKTVAGNPKIRAEEVGVLVWRQIVDSLIHYLS